jgi:signal transduction histidine kinase
MMRAAVVILMLFSCAGMAQDIDLGSHEKIFLNSHFKAFKDNSRTLTIHEISSAKFLSRFMAAGDIGPELFNTNYWISFTTAPGDPTPAVLIIDQSLVNFAELYTRDSIGEWRTTQSGSTIQNASKEIIAETPAFYVQSGRTSKTYFLKIIGNTIPPVYLMNVKFFNEWYGPQKRMITGIILGAILLNALLSIIQYFYTYKKVYLFYFAAMLGIVLYVIIAYGQIVYLSSFIYAKLPEFTMVASFLSQYLVLAFGIELLEIKKKTNTLYSYAWYFRYVLLLLFFIAVIFLMVGESGDRLLNTGIVTAVTLTVLCVLLGIVSIYKGQIFKTVAVVYMSSYIFFAALTVLEVLHLSFGLPKYLVVNYIMIGFLIETIGIGVALNLKTKIELAVTQLNLKQEQLEKFKILREANSMLEKQVEERTVVLRETVTELNVTNQQLTDALKQSEELKEELLLKSAELEATNNWKTKLIGIISHDLMSPLNSLASLFKLLNQNFLTQAEFKQAKDHIEESLSNLIQNLKGILKWVESQMVGSKINPDSFEVRPLAQSIIALLKETAGTKEIKLTNEVDDSLQVFADTNHVEVILRNLINNAIKFSHRGTTVVIASAMENGEAIIKVIDNGIGLGNVDPFDLNGKSRTGTNKEMGIGFGLIVCRELVEKNGGKIWAYNNDQDGSTFCFTLPLAREVMPIKSVLGSK